MIDYMQSIHVRLGRVESTLQAVNAQLKMSNYLRMLELDKQGIKFTDKEWKAVKP